MKKKLKEIRIIRGNDTTFSGNPPLKIKINTKADLTDYTADFTFGSIVKSFGTDEVSEKLLKLAYTSEETKTFFPGRGFAFLKLYDPQGRQATVWRFVFNVVFPYERPKCGGFDIEVEIGSAEDSIEVTYDAEKEMLIVDFHKSENGGNDIFQGIENVFSGNIIGD